MTNLLGIGAQALQNCQYALQVHGSNVTNQGVEGYARRTVSQVANRGVDTSVGQIGQGSSISQIVRHLDQYLESQALRQSGEASQATAKYDALSSLETLFVEDEDYGTAVLLSDFWSAWEDLAEAPDSDGARQALLSSAKTLADRLSSTRSSLNSERAGLEREIAAGVDEVNRLAKELAGINSVLAGATGDSSLLDERDARLRDLAELVDVSVSYGDDGQASVRTSSGLGLVDGRESYSLSLETPRSSSSLASASTFDGEAYFSGTSASELTLDVVSGGPASGAGAASYRMSLDGGRTWLTDESGAVRTFTAGEHAQVDGVDVWLGSTSDPDAAAGGDLAVGDRFTVVAKSSVYWNRTTSSQVNAAPLAGNDRAGSRLAGGKLAGLLEARDAALEYGQDLDELAATLVWEVNRVHSQGAGQEHLASVSGSNRSERTDSPLAESGLAFADRLAAGGVSLAFYDSTSGEASGIDALDFSSVTPGQATFDPSVHSLDDVAAAVNASFPGRVSASVQNGALVLTADSSTRFEFAEDSSGLLACLGLNCFLSGSDAASVAVDRQVASDPGRICASRVDGDGAVGEGDNTTATALSELASAKVQFRRTGGSTATTIGGFLEGLVSEVGSASSSAGTAMEQAEALSTALRQQQEEIGGVSLDEELTALTRYQQGYEAASRLIQVSMDMFDTLMSLKS